MAISFAERMTERFRARKQSLTKVVLPVLVLIFVMIWLIGAFQGGRVSGLEKFAKASRSVPPNSEMVTLKLTPREVIAEMMGEVKPEFTINVSSQITANIIKLNVRAGMRVKKGDELAQLDSRDVQARLEQAKESLDRAVADLDYARATNTRTAALLAQHAVSQSQYDLDHSRFLQAGAEVRRLRQALQEAQVSVSYTRIVSPVDGVVIDRMAEVGDLATPGKPLLVMFDPHHLWLQASVREEQSSRLKLEENYAVRIDALNLAVSGPLVEIVPSADALARTVYARVRLPVNAQLYPGMFGRLLLPTGETWDILIPHRAIRKVGQLDMVDCKTASGLEQRAVVVGASCANDQVEILSGLKPGEILVMQSARREARR